MSSFVQAEYFPFPHLYPTTFPLTTLSGSHVRKPGIGDYRHHVFLSDHCSHTIGRWTLITGKRSSSSAGGKFWSCLLFELSGQFEHNSSFELIFEINLKSLLNPNFSQNFLQVLPHYQDTHTCQILRFAQDVNGSRQVA